MSKVFISNGSTCFSGCKCLRDVKGLNVSENINRPDNMFSGCSLIKNIDFVLVLNGPINGLLRDCNRVQRIKGVDFDKASYNAQAFANCLELRVIEEVLNIKASGIDFSQCKKLTRDTVLRLKNACYDYSADTETTHNMTIGSENIAKLTDEEMAEWLQWGWTVS